mmetsp:Transcript_155161/g.497601  ORF Transcript_155161/g.497601 Transcript_155161/m.497601 type:complete len:455 (+) Transcript_155161:110-1474(+)
MYMPQRTTRGGSLGPKPGGRVAVPFRGGGAMPVGSRTTFGYPAGASAALGMGAPAGGRASAPVGHLVSSAPSTPLTSFRQPVSTVYSHSAALGSALQQRLQQYQQPHHQQQQQRQQMQQSPQQLPQYHQAHSHQAAQASPQYKLPWEDSMPEEGPPPEYANPPVYTDMAADKAAPDPRRRNGRRGVQDEGGPADAGERDRGTPSNREAGNNFGFRSGGGSSSKTSSVGRGAAEGLPASSLMPPAAMRHGASAGTGGSEEWPSNQGRGPSALREPEYESDKALVSGSQAGLPRRKPGRQPNLGGVQETPARRSPEATLDPRLAAQDAWRGEQAALEMHGGLGGLPSIHGGFLGGPQGSGLAEGPPLGAGAGSRGPSRTVTASTPTPRDEDALDVAARQLHGGHGFSGGGRWGASAAGQDWPGLGGPGPALPTASAEDPTSATSTRLIDVQLVRLR